MKFINQITSFHAGIQIATILFAFSPFYAPLSVVHASSMAALDAPINSVTMQIAGKLNDTSHVLIMDIQDPDGRTTYFGKYLADRISIGLANLNKFKVLDRQSIDPLFKERKLAEAGLVDEKTAAQFGRLLGANTVVYGTETEFESTLGINLKIVDIEKGVVMGGVVESIEKNRELSSTIGVVAKPRSGANEDIPKGKIDNSELDHVGNGGDQQLVHAKTSSIEMQFQKKVEGIKTFFNSTKPNTWVAITPNNGGSFRAKYIGFYGTDAVEIFRMGNVKPYLQLYEIRDVAYLKK